MVGPDVSWSSSASQKPNQGYPAPDPPVSSERLNRVCVLKTQFRRTGILVEFQGSWGQSVESNRECWMIVPRQLSGWLVRGLQIAQRKDRKLGDCREFHDTIYRQLLGQGMNASREEMLTG